MKLDPALLSAVEERASLVGLTRVSLASLGSEDLPDEVALYTGAYAVLLVWPVQVEASEAANPEGDNARALDEAFQQASAALYTVARSWERSNQFQDIYVLFALSVRPPDSWRGTMAHVERDASVCRKHVGYPGSADGKSWGEALDRVTVLSLPAALVAATPSGDPITPTDREIEEITNMESVAAALRWLDDQAPGSAGDGGAP